MEDNGINVNQVAPIISDFAFYCFKHRISFDTLIKSGYEALSLEKELGIPVKMLAEHITRAKKIYDDLLDKSQTEFAKLREANTECEKVVAEIEGYKKEYPLVERFIELKRKLNETNEKCKQDEPIIKGLRKDLSETNLNILSLEGANVEKDYQLKTALQQLSVC